MSLATPTLRRRRRRRATTFSAVLALLAAVALAACGSSSKSSSSSSSSAAGGGGATTASSSSSAAAGGGGGGLTLGTKNFTEEFVIGQLYKQALSAKGCKINYKENIGATEVVDKALTSGQIDAYPEYTGESVATVAGINKPVTSPQQEYSLAKQFYAKRGQVMSEMTPFFDTDAIAVTKAYAAKHGLKTTADLKKVGHFTLGARPEFLNRQEGAAGMKKVYGVKNFSFKSLALGLQYQALDSGAVQAIDVFTTDPQLASGKYVVLTDPQHIFGFQNVALVIDKNRVNACPGLITTVNGVNKLLTTPAITAMNKAVAIDHQQPAAVAAAFLKANKIS
jgi:osmoprotectant transport system substrate-binding protein